MPVLSAALRWPCVPCSSPFPHLATSYRKGYWAAHLEDRGVKGSLHLVQGGGCQGAAAAADEAQGGRPVCRVVLLCPPQQDLQELMCQQLLWNDSCPSDRICTSCYLRGIAGVEVP